MFYITYEEKHLMKTENHQVLQFITLPV